ncbi:MAG: tetratricopeptide repeat protein [Gallionella sp.]|jgi:MSHA biogenesis protein MshN
MSVINQVLNQLEQRGAHTAAEQVRAVPFERDTLKIKIVLLVFALVLAIGALAWKFSPANKPVLSLAEGPDVATINSGRSEPAATVTVSGVTAKPEADTILTASRLSFELSSVSLPSTFRPFDKVQNGFLSGQATSTSPGPALHAGKNSIITQPDLVPGKSTAEANKMLPDQRVLPVDRAVSSAGDVPVKQVSATQRADAEFRKASALMQHGHTADAVAGYEAALRMDAGYDQARQALVALLMESRRGMDAERVLQDGVKSKPANYGFAMLLARLQVERGAVEPAMATLEKSLPYAETQADYQAFFAALLQRLNRNDEAIRHYQIVLRLAPNNGIWLMGYGISLQAVQRNTEAKDAYRRALDTHTLSPDLQAFVRQKLKGL